MSIIYKSYLFFADILPILTVIATIFIKCAGQRIVRPIIDRIINNILEMVHRNRGGKVLGHHGNQEQVIQDQEDDVNENNEQEEQHYDNEEQHEEDGNEEQDFDQFENEENGGSDDDEENDEPENEELGNVRRGRKNEVELLLDNLGDDLQFGNMPAQLPPRASHYRRNRV